MKQKKATQKGPVHKKKQKQSKRREIGGTTRFLVIVMSVVLLAASLLASYARFRPVILTLPTQVYKYTRNADISYHIQNRPTEFFDQTMQGMGAVYLRSNAISVLPVIKYEISGVNVITISGKYQVVAILRQLDQADPNKQISSKTIPLTDEMFINTVDSGISLEESAQVDLAAVNDMVIALEQDIEQEVSYELEIGLQTDFTLSSSGQEIAKIQERPGMIMPLEGETFTIRLLDLQDKKDSIWRFQDWRLELSPMPVWLYPAAVFLSLMLLIFFLATTRTRKRQKFTRQLQKMLRMARGRLMMIGDKAWEPEWCITASNFKTMVKTARRLKHPIFCYIDRDSDVPAALFYVYYGENNYCYTYTGSPDRKWSKQFDRETPVTAKTNNNMEPLIELPPIGNKSRNEEKLTPLPSTDNSEKV